MNKQQGSNRIEWCDFTWNVIGGCKHACRWQMPDKSIAKCYAETVAEGVAHGAYPGGFGAHYWRPHLLEEPLKLKAPAKIFLDSMSDLMGHWVPDEQIEQVLDVCRRAHWHTFQLLTKNAPRLLDFAFPPNVWVGVSAPPSFMMGKPLSFEQQRRMVQKQLTVFHGMDHPRRWMSIEPLSFDIAPLLVWAVGQFVEALPLEWVVIGAASNGHTKYQPDPVWVRNVLEVLDAFKVPVFYKGNLRGNEAITAWREEFPDTVRQLELPL